MVDYPNGLTEDLLDDLEYRATRGVLHPLDDEEAAALVVLVQFARQILEDRD